MLPARTGTGFGIAVSQAAFLALVALVSFFIGLGYLINGSATKFSSAEFCCAMVWMLTVLLMIGGSVLNIINAVSVAKRTGSKNSRRAFYVFVLYPIVLFLFVIPSIKEMFFTSLIFGFPVFLAGVVLLPLFSFTLMREAFKISKNDYVISDCVYCHFPFRRLAVSQDAICPRCGAYNIFPQQPVQQQPAGAQAPPPRSYGTPQVQRAVPMNPFEERGGMEWDDTDDDGFNY